MWKALSVTKDDIDYFRDLIPEYCQNPFEEDELKGVAFRNTDSETDPLVGIILYSVVDGMIMVEWVSLTENYDPAEYGAEMISLLSIRARIEGGFRGVSARFREEDRMAEFFPKNTFTWKTESRGVYRFRLRDVEALQSQESKAKLKNCIQLGQTDRTLHERFLKNAEEQGELLPLPDPVPWERYDPQISAFYLENNEPVGAVLIEMTEAELVIRLLYSANPVATISLLEYAFKNARMKYWDEQEVACPVLNEISDALVKKIVSEPEREEMIRAELLFPPGTGLPEDFDRYAPETGNAAEK